MKKITGKQVKTGIAGILLAVSVLCYCAGIGRGTETRVLGQPSELAEADSGLPVGQPAELTEAGSGLLLGQPAELTDAGSGLPMNNAAVGTDAAAEAVGGAESAAGSAGSTGGDGIAAGSAGSTGSEGIAAGNAADMPDTEFMAAPIYVHVCGAVQNPGVYELEAGSRACDAVEAAGGLTDAAAAELLNLAQALADGQQLRVPDQEEEKALKEAGLLPEAGAFSGMGAFSATGTVSASGGSDFSGAARGADSAASGKVNINTASKEQLMTLSGIGEARAEAILAYRREAGPFLAIEDIMNVSGIKEAAFQKIREDITV